jgi:hypothetical protein
LGFNLGDAVECVIVHTGAETAFVDVSRVETSYGAYAGVHRSSKREVAADANAHDAQGAGAWSVGL